MNFVMAGSEKKRFGVFIQTMRRFDEYAETFFKKPEAFFQVLRQYTFDALATCGRWGSNVQSLELDRAVDSLPSYYSMTMPEFTSHFFVYTY